MLSAVTTSLMEFVVRQDAVACESLFLRLSALLRDCTVASLGGIDGNDVVDVSASASGSSALSLSKLSVFLVRVSASSDRVAPVKIRTVAAEVRSVYMV